MEAVRLNELTIGKYDEKYFNVKYAEIKKRNSKELEDINKALKEMHYYKYCDKKKDDKCEHFCCMYSCLYFSDKECKYICNRGDYKL